MRTCAYLYVRACNAACACACVYTKWTFFSERRIPKQARRPNTIQYWIIKFVITLLTGDENLTLTNICILMNVRKFISWIFMHDSFILNACCLASWGLFGVMFDLGCSYLSWSSCTHALWCCVRIWSDVVLGSSWWLPLFFKLALRCILIVLEWFHILCGHAGLIFVCGLPCLFSGLGRK